MELSSVIGLIVLLIMGPIIVKFADRTYKKTKETSLYKDLLDEQLNSYSKYVERQYI